MSTSYTRKMRLLLLGMCATLLSAQPREPYLYVRLLKGGRQAANNERIPLQICVKSKTVADRFEQPEIEALNQAPGYFNNRPPANIKLSIWRVSGGSREEVAFRVNSGGGGKDLTVWFVDADIDLLESKDIRLERAKKFVDWMASQGQDSRAQLLQTPAGKERMASYFEEQYINNPPGDYEIIAHYTPTTNWKGSLTSAPFRLTVDETADFFDAVKAKAAGRR